MAHRTGRATAEGDHTLTALTSSTVAANDTAWIWAPRCPSIVFGVTFSVRVSVLRVYRGCELVACIPNPADCANRPDAWPQIQLLEPVPVREWRPVEGVRILPGSRLVLEFLRVGAPWTIDVDVLEAPGTPNARA